MSARSPLTLSSVALVAFAATVCFTSLIEAADVSHPQGHAVAAPAANPRTTAARLAEIQHRLTALTVATEAEDGAVKALAQSLMAVRGVKEDAGAIVRLATLVADVLANGALAEYEVERLAQGLFAASSNSGLSDRDGGLLALDIAVLVQEAGADTAAITDILTAVQQICPTAKLPPSGLPVRATARTLSALSPQ